MSRGAFLAEQLTYGRHVDGWNGLKQSLRLSYATQYEP